MDNPRPEKVAVVTEVRERFASSQAAIVAEYRGLKVKDLQALRQAVSASGAEVKIYKNTLVRFAARDLGIDGLEPLLTGPTAIAFVDQGRGDAAAAAKALRDFARTNPLLVVKGGLLGEKVVDADGAKALADLPSRDTLLSQIAGLFAAPMQQMASLLEALPRSFAYGLQALADKGGAAATTSAAGAPAPAAEPAAAAPEITDETPDETPAEATEADAPTPAAEAADPADPSA